MYIPQTFLTNLRLFLYLLANLWHVGLHHHREETSDVGTERQNTASTATAGGGGG